MSKALIDDAGQAHQRADNLARVISLVPSLTELMFDLGLSAQLVGRTNFCIHPVPAINDIVSVGGTKQVDMDKIHALKPTHALVNIDETPKPLADELAGAGIEVIVTHPIDVRDNLRLYRLIGGIFGASDAAEGMCGQFNIALHGLQQSAKDWPARRVLYLIWRKPWMSISRDTYIAAMLSEANWHVVDHHNETRYPEIDLTDALLSGVDQVLFSTEPFPFETKHLEAFRTAFPDHADKARLIDAEMVSWYGSRAIAGLSYLRDFVAELQP